MSATEQANERPAYIPFGIAICWHCGTHKVEFTHKGGGSFTGKCPECGAVGIDAIRFGPAKKGAD